MIEKYAYSTNSYDWNESADSKEKAIKEAFKCLYYEKHGQIDNEETVYIGNTVKYENLYLGYQVAEILADDAYDFADEFAEEFMNLTDEHEKILSERLNEVIEKFQKEFGYEPTFFNIENVEKITKSKAEIEELIKE